MDDGHDSALLRRHRPTDSFCHRPLSLSMPPNRSPGAFACPTACGIKFRLPLNTFFYPRSSMGFTLTTLQGEASRAFLECVPEQIECFHLCSGVRDHLPQLPCAIGVARPYTKNTKIPLPCNRLRNTFTNKIAPLERQFPVFRCRAGFLLGFTFGVRIAKMLGMRNHGIFHSPLGAAFSPFCRFQALP